MTTAALPTLSEDDLNHMFYGLSTYDWSYFKGKRLFVTGGSGFIGKWLLSALIEADHRLSLGCRIEILTRSPLIFSRAIPQIACAKNVKLHEGDVRNFKFPEGNFDIVVHAATDIALQRSPSDIFTTCVDGTRRALEFSKVSHATDFLLTSSGAVYGKHPSEHNVVDESYLGGPDHTRPESAYGEGKRVSEWLACTHASETGLRVKIARIYAQVGPYLPLDKHFAIGNFINDAMSDREILIRGDGTPLRSYLHAADTAIWLWAMVVRGEPNRAWNVGSDNGISIAQLAQRVGQLLDSTKGVRVLMESDPGKTVERYVPNIHRAMHELKPPTPISLDDSIFRTASWIRKNRVIS